MSQYDIYLRRRVGLPIELLRHHHFLKFQPKPTIDRHNNGTPGLSPD